MVSRLINELEETLIAVLLALMTIITFANVVARYVFNSNLLWALEATTYLFAWLVILGASYGVKVSAHLGIDALVNRFPHTVRHRLTLLAVLACVAYAGIMLYGSWEYWSRFFYKLSFLETQDIPFPAWIQQLFGLTEDGAPLYEKLPRYIPYFVLPLGMFLLLLRFLQAGYMVMVGHRPLIIASHEAEDMLAEAEQARKRGH